MSVGRPAEKYSQAHRLLQIAEILQHRSHVTLTGLAEEFEVDRRTVQRDVQVLMDVFAIDDSERNDSNEKMLRLAPGARTETLKLTLSEMIALYLGRDLFRFAEGTELKSAIDSVYDKLKVRLSRRNADVQAALPKKLFCTGGAPKSYKRRDDVLNEILTGLIGETKVSITYQRPNKNKYEDVIHPYSLVLHRDALYVRCWSEHSEGQRTLALERILKASWERTEKFDYPKTYDPARVFKGAFGISTGQEVESVKIRFSKAVAPYVLARKWHRSMKTKRNKDGSAVVTMNVSPGEELTHWLTGYGPEARVITPKHLATEIKSRHRAALKSR